MGIVVGGRTGAAPAALLLALTFIAAGCATEAGIRVMGPVDAGTLALKVDRCPVKVRLTGVDGPWQRLKAGRSGFAQGPPARVIEGWDKRARDFVARLTRGRAIKVMADDTGVQRDSSGRLLVYVMLPDGRILNEEILRAGFGLAANSYAYRHRLGYLRLEAEARDRRRGLWSDPEFRRFAAASRP